MTRNRIAAVLTGLMLTGVCAPSAAAQASSVPQAASAPSAPMIALQAQDPVQITKTAAPAGAAAWEVTLTVKGSGAQTLTQSADIVLLLDCSAGMAAQLEHALKTDEMPAVVLPKAAAQNILAAAEAAVRAADQQKKLLPAQRKGALLAVANRTEKGEVMQESRAHTGTEKQIAPTERATRISEAKRAVQAFLTALTQEQIPARIGVIAYAGKAEVLLPLTPLQNMQSQDGAQADKPADIVNAVENLWQVAYEPNDLCYGSGRGANLERALTAADAMLKESAAAAKYVVTVGGIQPCAIGENEQSSLVPDTDPAYAREMKVAFETRAAVQSLLENGVARVFTVGTGTSGLSAYASQGAAYTAKESDMAAPLCEIAALLKQGVQSPSVTDSAGEGFVIQQAGVQCAPQSVGVGAQPYVTVSPDGKSLYWYLGAWLPEQQTATLRYTLKVADSAYATAGKDLPLGSATLVYTAPKKSGALESLGVPAVPPTVHYVTGALRVYTSGLPAQLGGTSHNVGPTPVTGTAYFQVQKPAEHSGWRVDSVIVNGETHTPAQFAALTGYRLPVKEGVTVVEYRYVPAPVPAEQWSYNVQYYRDGLLLPDGTDTADVPAANPVVNSVPGRLSSLPDCVENPIRIWPYTLRQNGETLRVDYLTKAREGAQVYIRHTYNDAAGTQTGTHTTAPAADAASYNVRELFAPGYGGNVYMPTLATLTCTSADGTQAQSLNLALGETFSAEEGNAYLLEIKYVPMTQVPAA